MDSQNLCFMSSMSYPMFRGFDISIARERSGLEKKTTSHAFKILQSVLHVSLSCPKVRNFKRESSIPREITALGGWECVVDAGAVI